MNINLSLIKRIAKEDNFDNLRYYLILKDHFYKKSGLFKIDDLINILNQDFNYKTLTNNPGNQRARFKNKIENEFNNSILFRKSKEYWLLNGTRKFNFIKHKKIEIMTNDLLTNRQFIDGIIAGISISRQFIGINELANILQLTERRIQQGIRRLLLLKRIKKIKNLIIPDLNIKNNSTEINKIQKELYHKHGLITSFVVFKHIRYLVLYWKNSFVVKSQTSKLHLQVNNKFPLKLITDIPKNYNLWEFNNQVYSFQDYLNDFGFKRI